MASRNIEATAIGKEEELWYCEKHYRTTIIFRAADCPACDELKDTDNTLAEIRKKNKNLRKELKLARYELRDARDKLSVLKSETAEYLALRKQVKDSISERL